MTRAFREGDQVVFVGRKEDFGPAFGQLYIWSHYHDDKRLSGAIKPVNGSSARLWVMERDVVPIAEYDAWREATARRLLNEAILEISEEYGVSIIMNSDIAVCP